MNMIFYVWLKLNMFKEVIEPICKYLSLNYQFKNIALTENRKLAFNFRNSVND